MSGAEDLQTRLSRQRQNSRYRRRRAVRQFSHRMRAAGLIGCLFLALLLLLTQLFVWRVGWDWFAAVQKGIILSSWLYLASMPLLFGWRTGLHAYTLYEHWTWLAAWWALPIDYFFLRFSLPNWRWIPILFLALAVLGRILLRRRKDRFVREVESRSLQWEALLPLGVIDLLLLGYWRSGRQLPDSPD